MTDNLKYISIKENKNIYKTISLQDNIRIRDNSSAELEHLLNCVLSISIYSFLHISQKDSTKSNIFANKKEILIQKI